MGVNLERVCFHVAYWVILVLGWFLQFLRDEVIWHNLMELKNTE